MKIYGAGIAGLLAGNVLRRFSPAIYEAQSQLPNNHGALLRFRSDICSRLTNIPFKKVNVQKAIWDYDNNILVDKPRLDLVNQYSQKVTDQVVGRSIRNLDPSERYIAPDHFIGMMAKDLNVSYDVPLNFATLESNKDSKTAQPIISTIPMPTLMDMVGWKKPDFKFQPIISAWGEIKQPHTDVYQTIYFPDPQTAPYRISITGNKYIAEYMYHDKYDSGDVHSFHERAMATIIKDANDALKIFGIGGTVENLEFKVQQYGKLLPIDDQQRKEFILYMTDVYKVYSLGRFATWRQILLDDIAFDIDRISNFITQRDDYSRKLENMKG